MAISMTDDAESMEGEKMTYLWIWLAGWSFLWILVWNSPDERLPGWWIKAAFWPVIVVIALFFWIAPSFTREE